MIKIYPNPGSEQTVIDVLDSLKGPFAANVDCLSCTITVETDGTGAVCYSEHWKTRAAFDRHLRSALFGRVLEAMELSSRSPDVAFYDVTEIGGLKLVEQARTASVEMKTGYQQHH
jgi:quinol monooxygenase YgiN